MSLSSICCFHVMKSNVFICMHAFGVSMPAALSAYMRLPHMNASMIHVWIFCFISTQCFHVSSTLCFEFISWSIVCFEFVMHVYQHLLLWSCHACVAALGSCGIACMEHSVLTLVIAFVAIMLKAQSATIWAFESIPWALCAFMTSAPSASIR